MDTDIRYRSDYETYAPSKVHYRKRVKHCLSHERFVVPWQMEENKKEKTNKK